MATKKVVEEGQEEDFISGMNEVELIELQKKVDVRWNEIKQEKAMEMAKTIKLGNFILYSTNGRNKYCGMVEMITSNFIGLKKVGAEGRQKNKRIFYENVVAVSEQLEEGWIVEEEKEEA